MYAVTTVPLPEDGRAYLEALAAPRRRRGWLGALAALSNGRDGDGTQAERARAALARGTCEEVRLHHDTPPLVSEHEHGLMVFTAAGNGQTLLLDISSVSEDPRWDLHEAGGLMRADWRWLRLPDLGVSGVGSPGLQGPIGFRAEGAPIQPIALPFFHDTALERRLTEEMDYPGDDALLPLSLAEIDRLARATPNAH